MSMLARRHLKTKDEGQSERKQMTEAVGPGRAWRRAWKVRADTAVENQNPI